MSTETPIQEVRFPVDAELYQDLEAIARQEHRSVPQTAQQLLQEGLRLRRGAEEVTGEQMAALAMAGGSFDWLDEEPDLYDDSCGEPI